MTVQKTHNSIINIDDKDLLQVGQDESSIVVPKPEGQDKTKMEGVIFKEESLAYSKKEESQNHSEHPVIQPEVLFERVQINDGL